MDIEIDSAADKVILSTLREGKPGLAADPGRRAARAPRITDSLHRRLEVLATSL